MGVARVAGNKATQSSYTRDSANSVLLILNTHGEVRIQYLKVSTVEVACIIYESLMPIDPSHKSHNASG